ncbi:MAG: AbrB family transcriptional regulator [Aestuariivirga sp.]
MPDKPKLLPAQSEAFEDEGWSLRSWMRHDLPLILAAIVGGLALIPTGLPASWLIGGVLGVIALMLIAPRENPTSVTVETGMVIAGITLGSAATPEAVLATARYPGSIVLLMLAMLMIVAATSALLVFLGRWTRLDALLGSAPGALSTVIAIALDRRAGMERIATIQLFRLYAIILLLPPLIYGLGVAPVIAPAPPQPLMGWQGLVMLVCASLAAALLFRRIGMASPMILGASAASAALHATDVVTGALPQSMVIAGFVLIAVAIGGRFARLDLKELISLMPLALLAFAVSMAIAVLFAWPASVIAGVPLLSAIIAFAPGGLEAMAMLAFALGLDPLYVAAHHLIRFFAIAFALPFVAAWLMRGRKSGGKND